MKYIKLYDNFSITKLTSNIKILKVICDSYLETAIWTEEQNNPNLEGKSIYDFTDEAKEQAKQEIIWFIEGVFELLDNDEVFDVQCTYTTIGHDLWLTRNHEGAGFFNRIEYDDETLDILKILSHQLDDIEIEIDENDKLYFDMYSEKYKDFDIFEYKKQLELEKETSKYNL